MKLNSIIKVLIYFFSLPKSLYVCLKLLPFKRALSIPIWVRYNVKCCSLRGIALLPCNTCMGGVKIGFQGVGTQDVKYQRSVLEINGIIEFKGKAVLGSGCQIHVGSSGRLILGNNFLNTATGHISCSNYVSFGENALLAWDTLVMDSDFHEIEICDTGKSLLMTKPVIVGNNVWLGTRAVILKGSTILDNTIVGANSTVSGKKEEGICIIAGTPAIVVRRNCKRKL